MSKHPDISINDGPLSVNTSGVSGYTYGVFHASTHYGESEEKPSIDSSYFAKPTADEEKLHRDEFISLRVKTEGREFSFFMSAEQAEECIEKLKASLAERAAAAE